MELSTFSTCFGPCSSSLRLDLSSSEVLLSVGITSEMRPIVRLRRGIARSTSEVSALAHSSWLCLASSNSSMSWSLLNKRKEQLDVWLLTKSSVIASAVSAQATSSNGSTAVPSALSTSPVIHTALLLVAPSQSVSTISEPLQ